MSVGIERTGTPVLGTASVGSAFVVALGLNAAFLPWLLYLDAGPGRIAFAWVATVLLVVLAQEAPQLVLGSGRLDNRHLLRMSMALFLFAMVGVAYQLTLAFPVCGVAIAAVHISRSGSRVWREAVALTAVFTLGLQVLLQVGAFDSPLPLPYAHVTALVTLVVSAIGMANLGLSFGVAEVANRNLAEANRKLTDAELRFRLLVQTSSDAVTVLDSQSRFSYASPACTEVLAVEGADLLGRPLAYLVDAEDLADCQERIAGLLSGGDDAGMRWEVRGSRADGPAWLELSARSLAAEAEPSVLLSLRDVSERRAAQEELSHAATHDHLTGLKTRREFLRQASRATAAASPSSTVALLFCDLDGFKGVNDVYGHAAGDEVLRAIASRLRRSLRPQELIGRIGGDEFAVLLPGPVDEHGVAVIADRLQAAIAPAITLRGGSAVRIGMSIGTAIVTRPTADAETVLPQADREMYAMKASSRLSQV